MKGKKTFIRDFPETSVWGNQADSEKSVTRRIFSSFAPKDMPVGPGL
jgi:hypothetical protein